MCDSLKEVLRPAKNPIPFQILELCPSSTSNETPTVQPGTNELDNVIIDIVTNVSNVQMRELFHCITLFGTSHPVKVRKTMS